MEHSAIASPWILFAPFTHNCRQSIITNRLGCREKPLGNSYGHNRIIRTVVVVRVEIKIGRFRLQKLVCRAYDIAYDSAKNTTLSNMVYIYWLGINTLLLTLL